MSEALHYVYAVCSMQKGFTLIELILITGLIGVLMTGIIVFLNPLAQVNKTYDARRKSDLAQVQKALELYYQDNGRYPPVSSGYRINNLNWGSAWTPYMTALPTDPNAPTRTYVYNASADGQSYWLYANLSRGADDPQACAGGNNCPYAPGTASCGGVCNFGLSSPNVSR